MEEGRIFIDGDQRLEGLLEWPAPDLGAGADVAAAADGPADDLRGGVVVAHPYPPHGGNMELPVIHRIAKCSRQKGFASLRFNFRSVGASAGRFSGTEERRDVIAAVSYMGKQLRTASAGGATGGDLPIGLAGWSFGSIMSARAVTELPVVKALALIGFGVGWDQLPADTLERLTGYRGPVLAVCSETDDFAAPKDVERVLEKLDLDYRMRVIEGADHFLEGRQGEVGESVADFFAEVL